jgi:LmbE family N-acetylglucosaminyl deacetylase
MRESGPEVFPRRFSHMILSMAAILVLAALVASAAPPETSGDTADPVKPLPQDSGVTGLKQMLRRLNTTARLMQTTAHPDDEDGGMLTLESRGKGATTLLLTLNRGEGGQNKVGSNLFDVLGVLRTLELLASDRYYGVEQRFTRVADFGFSKNPEETFQKWQGHDVALGDMVRVIRTFRPDVLVARFSGTDRDGHGNHQASAILTVEAFRAAADPARFPEQIREGLAPWQAKKLYIGNVCGFMANTCPDENYTLRLNTGEHDALLGASYIEFAMRGLKHQLSQGAGGWSVEPGDRFTYYKKTDTVLQAPANKNAHEQDFFDGIDTTLSGLASRLGSEEQKVPFLPPGLAQLQKDVTNATQLSEKNPIEAGTPLLDGLAVVQDLIEKTGKSSGLSRSAEQTLLAELRTKEEEFEKAANLALGIQLEVSVDAPAGPSPEEAFMAIPGQSFNLNVRMIAPTLLENQPVAFDLPRGWTSKLIHQQVASSSGQSYAAKFQITVPADAQFTRPYWHRDDPETEGVNKIDQPQYATLPFPPPPLKAHMDYKVGGKRGTARAVAMVDYGTLDGPREHWLAVGPPFSVALEPSASVIPVSHQGATSIKVGVKDYLTGSSQSDLRLALPAGWHAAPPEQPIGFQKTGESKDADFQVFPGGLKEKRERIEASLEHEKKKYADGFNVVARGDLDTFYYYQPAVQRVSIVDVKVPQNLRVGYVMGAGDEIPTVLTQLGMNVTLVPAEKLASAELSEYRTIVLGIRAYDTQKDLVANNKRLMEFVSGGGTLVVQYNASVGDFNSGHFTPYPAQLSRARVSVEEAPVDILAKDDSIFHYPNEIGAHDFDGWVQERGLYFMNQWDKSFTPLLACHDPGEQPQQGGLLRAQFGKGTYIYTGYSFFRQLPAGVPGAVRLYVNILSAGHEK